MNKGDVIHGFQVTNIRRTEDGEFVEMSHMVTGARLAWMNNGDENKLFSVSFKTVPEDDTGVFHILEHSVLGGSERYTVKEPFLYLLKGSMNTFLNAMTFPDKTMFPVSSRNSADFMNLTRVYLDAVFKPAIYTQPNIFYQEGHHTEWNGEGEPVYKGVVFNEMKGCMSSVEEQIDCHMMKMLFPESSYRFVYGGLPSAIPDLTYEQFLEAHRRFYHPGNSYFYLDGSVDPDAVLELIDEYLADFGRAENLPEIPWQTPVAPCFRREYYEIPEEEEETEHTHIALGKVVADWQDRKRIFGYIVLTEVLTGSNDSRFKREILDSGLCLDVNARMIDDIMQPFAMLHICNTDEEKADELLAAVKKAAESLTAEGIGRETLEAAINRCEFRFRQSEEPKGLTRCIYGMSSWLHGGDPLEYIQCGDVFDKLRDGIETGYFEELLSQWLLREEGRAVLCMLPSRTLGREQTAAEKERITAEFNALDDRGRAALAELNRELAEWQAAPDTKEAVDTLPRLPLSEVSPEPIEFKTTVSEEHGFTLLRHPARDHEIMSVNLYFSVADLTPEELDVLVIMERLILELPTQSSTGAELQRKIMGIFGDISTALLPYGTPDKPEECGVYFVLRARFLRRNFKAAQELMAEILTETVFDDTRLISEILKQDEEDEKQVITANGHSFAMKRARSVLSAESALIEKFMGFESYKLLHRAAESDDSRLKKLSESMKKLSQRIFSRKRLTASITSAEECGLKLLASLLPEGIASGAEKMAVTCENADSSGVIVPAGVAYTGAVLSSRNTDKAVFEVLSSLLTYEYLWNEVRVKGGAYGTGCVTNKMGETAFYSYRDPSPGGTFGTFAEAADFVRGYCGENPDISSYIISTIASGEPLMSDSSYGIAADGMYFRGITFEERCDVRRRMLELDCGDLIKAADALENIGSRCVFGSKEAVSSCGDLIKNVESLT